MPTWPAGCRSQPRGNLGNRGRLGPGVHWKPSATTLAEALEVAIETLYYGVGGTDVITAVVDDFLTRCAGDDHGERLTVARDTNTRGARITVATWAEFSHQAPDLAEKGRALLYRTGVDEALLATVRDDTSRVHPIAVAVNASGLYSFILPSPKLTDLEADGRYPIHAYPDAEEPHEDLVRGRVRPVYEGTRATLAPSARAATICRRGTAPGRWPARRRADIRPRRPASLGHRVIKTTVAVDGETLLRVIGTGAAAPDQTADGGECYLAGAMESASKRGPAPW